MNELEQLKQEVAALRESLRIKDETIAMLWARLGSEVTVSSTWPVGDVTNPPYTVTCGSAEVTRSGLRLRGARRMGGVIKLP